MILFQDMGYCNVEQELVQWSYSDCFFGMGRRSVRWSWTQVRGRLSLGWICVMVKQD